MHNNNNKNTFWIEYGEQCRKIVKSPYWIAAHIFVFLLCIAKDIATLPLIVLALGFWVLSYRFLLLDNHPDNRVE